jgi:hypothetical protein
MWCDFHFMHHQAALWKYYCKASSLLKGSLHRVNPVFGAWAFTVQSFTAHKCSPILTVPILASPLPLYPPSSNFLANSYSLHLCPCASNFPYLFPSIISNYYQVLLSRDSSVGMVTGYGVDGRGSIPGSGKRYFSSAACLDRLWGPPSRMYNEYNGAFFPRVKRQKREADHSPAGNAEVKNGADIPPLPLTTFRHGAWLIKLRDKFILFLSLSLSLDGRSIEVGAWSRLFITISSEV